MSESTASAAPPGTSGGGSSSAGKTLGLTRSQWLIGAAVFIGALAWFWYRSHKASSAAASTASTAAPATGECTDANGNPTPCEEMAGIDYSGQLSTMQTELESLLAAGGTPGPAGPAGPTGPTGATGTTTATQVSQYPPVPFTVSKLSSTSAKVTFHPLTSPKPIPATYTIEAWTVAGQLASQQTVSAPDSTGGVGQYTITGLKSGACYNVRVWANGGKTAPTGTTEKVCV